MPAAIPFAVAAFQAAAAVATTVGTAMGFSGALATVAGAAAIYKSTTDAWGAISSALSPKPKVSAAASQLQTKVGAVTPRAIVMGRTAVAGTLLTPTPLQSGRGNALATNFYTLSHCGPSGVVESVIWGDDTVTFDAQGQAIGKYANNMWLFQRNGSWTQNSITFTGTPGIGADTPAQWDATKRAQGCLVVGLVVRYAASVLANNMQTPLFVVNANAVALTDPRTGLAATTQAQRRNPAVWAYSWRLGWFQNSRRVIGLGQPANELHAAGYAYAANVADANNWTISGEATTADDRYAVEMSILQACASVPVERNGLQSVVTSALRSSVGTITSDDLRANPNWRYNSQQSSRPTAIQTRFRSEGNRWQMVEGAEVTDPAWLAEDAGREKRVSIEYAFAGGGAAHVGHLAALDACNAREPLIFSLPCKQQARYCGFAGEAVTVSLPQIGLSSTKMVIVSRTVNSDGTVDLDLLVETDSKYAFAAGKTSVAPAFTLQPGFDVFSVPMPDAGDWAATAVQITSGGTSLPIVRVTGSASNYAFCSGVIFKIRLNAGGSAWLESSEAPPFVGQHEFRGLTEATSYIVGVSYRGATGLEGPVRELAAVTSGALVVGNAAAVPWGGVTGSGRPEDNATRNRILVGTLGSRPAGSLGDFYFATDDNNGAGLLYVKTAGDWVADPKAKVLFDNLSATVGGNEAINSAFRSAQASDNAAQAARISQTEAAFRFPVPEAINKNPTFASWPGGSGTYPDDWGDWQNGLTNSRVAGSISPYAFRQAKTSSFANFGLVQGLDGKLTAGWYVLEADITLNSGSLIGTGLYLHYGPTGSITNSHFLSFADPAEPDISGAINGIGTPGRRYRYSKLVQLVNSAGSAQLFTMTSWDIYGSTVGQVKDVTWHKALIRPATQGEIDAKVAKDTTIPATVARIEAEETARASADSALANQVNTVQAAANGNPNLFPYPTPIENRTPAQLGWQGSIVNSTYYPPVGGHVYWKSRPSGGGAGVEYYFFDLPGAFDFGPSNIYTLSAYGYGGGGVAGDRLQMRIEILNPSTGAIEYASPKVLLNHSSGQRVSINTSNYSGGFLPARKLRVVFDREFPASVSYQDAVFNMIKVEAGPIATAFTNSAQAIVQANAIATLNDSAAFYQILVNATGGDPAIVRLFSGLGGSEISLAAKILTLINTADGSALEVMRAIGGLAFFRRPISSDAAGRRITIGPGFGVDGSKVVLWFGPDSLAPDAQSRTNGYFALGTDGQIYYGSAILDNAAAGARQGRAETANGISGGWAAVVGCDVGNAAAGFANFNGSGFVPLSLGGSGASTYQFRLKRGSSVIWTGAEFEGVDGSGASTPDWFEQSSIINSLVLGVVAGAARYDLEARRVTGSSFVNTSSAVLNVQVLPS